MNRNAFSLHFLSLGRNIVATLLNYSKGHIAGKVGLKTVDVSSEYEEKKQ